MEDKNGGRPGNEAMVLVYKRECDYTYCSKLNMQWYSFAANQNYSVYGLYTGLDILWLQAPGSIQHILLYHYCMQYGKFSCKAKHFVQTSI